MNRKREGKEEEVNNVSSPFHLFLRPQGFEGKGEVRSGRRAKKIGTDPLDRPTDRPNYAAAAAAAAAPRSGFPPLSPTGRRRSALRGGPTGRWRTV